MRLLSIMLVSLASQAMPALAEQSSSTDCQNPALAKRELHLVFENDVFAEKLGLSKSDRWYTNGVKAIAKINHDEPPWWYSKSWEKLTQKDANQACMEFGITFGQMMYTPMDIKQSAPQINDRFWGGWLYVGTLLQSRPRLRDAAARGDLETFELDVGVVGPLSLAQQSQKTVHALIGAPTPAGWHNQLKSELAIQTTYSRAFTFKQAHNNLLGFDLAAHYGFGLGTLFNYANAGATIRIGNNLSGAPVGTIENPSLMAFEQPANRAYVLARVDAKASLHNTFIDGSLLRQAPHASNVRSKHLVLQATVGLVIESKSLAVHRFAFLFNRRSAEFNTPPGAASLQNFGTMLLEVDF
mgnify:CR=1 FL=1